MKPNPSENDTAIPDELMSSLTTGLYRFLATGPKTTNDNTQRKSSHNVRRECKTEIPIPKGHGSCIDIHAYTTGRNHDQSTGRIELSRQPREMWYGSKDTEKHLVTYLKCIRPLTQLTEKMFQLVVPEVFNKYKLVWDELEVGALGDNVRRSFSIWTSRKIVLCAATDTQLDLLHVPLGYCAIIPLGKFTDGHICLPSLGIKLELQPGESSVVKTRIIRPCSTVRTQIIEPHVRTLELPLPVRSGFFLFFFYFKLGLKGLAFAVRLPLSKRGDFGRFSVRFNYSSSYGMYSKIPSSGKGAKTSKICP